MISVIVPTYNQSRYLPRAIESVWIQGIEDIEIVVVDDGSTDDTDAVLAGMLKDSRLRCFRQPNQGPAAARNRGIRESRGELIAFLDSDDFWAPGKLKAQLGALERTGNRFSYCGFQMIDDRGAALGHRLARGDDFEFSQLIWGNRCGTPTVLVQRSLLDECGPFDESLRTGEDWDLWLRFSAKGPGACVPEPLVLVHGTNRWQADRLQLDAYETSIDKVLNRMFALVAAREDLAPFMAKKGQIRSWHLAVLAKSFFHARQFGRSFRTAIRSVLSSPRGLLYLSPFDHHQRLTSAASKGSSSPADDRLGESSLARISQSPAKPSVSVVIRTFNRAAMLRDALDSVLAQTVAPTEVLVVDDASTDETPQVMADYVKAHQSIRYLPLARNIGMEKAGRLGVEESTSEYVAFLDSDDIWLPSHIEECLAELKRTPGAVLVFSGYGLMNADGQTLTARVSEPRLTKPALMTLLCKRIVVQPTRAVLLRQAILDVKAIPFVLATDWILHVLVAARFPDGVVQTSGSTAVFRIHGSQSYSRPDEMRTALLEATEYLFVELPADYSSLKPRILAINLLHSAVFLWQAGKLRQGWQSVAQAVSTYPRCIGTKEFCSAIGRLVVPSQLGQWLRNWKRTIQLRY